jgi:excisionase family DNA binding protein
MDAPLLRVHEAARLLKVSKWTVYRWIEEGRLEATKIGRGSLRIFRSSVAALIDGNRTRRWGASAASLGTKVVSLRSAGSKKKK